MLLYIIPFYGFFIGVIMDKKAYTINEFCELYSLKRNLYFTLRKKGLMPAYLKIGKKVLIPIDAIKEWEINLKQQ